MRKRIRQSTRRPLSALSAEVQSLESRCLPAGTVAATLTANGITLNGDRSDNFIEVDLTPTGVFVRGVDGTNIKFGARIITNGSPLRLATSPQVTNDLVINLKDGHDSVSVYVGGSEETPVAATISRNLKIDSGRGEDFVEVEVRDGSLTVGGGLDINLGNDSDYLLLNGDAFVEEELPDNHEESETAPFHVNGLAKITGGTGDDVVGIVDFSTGGNLQVETGHGDDSVGIDTARIGANLTISTGSENDDVGIAFVLVLGRTNITTGSGNDRVGIFSAHSEGNVSILLQQGSDTLAAIGELSVGEDASVTLNGGSGQNEIDTLAADPESEFAGASTVIGFEAFDSPELVFDILDDISGEIFGEVLP